MCLTWAAAGQLRMAGAARSPSPPPSLLARPCLGPWQPRRHPQARGRGPWASTRPARPAKAWGGGGGAAAGSRARPRTGGHPTPPSWTSGAWTAVQGIARTAGACLTRTWCLCVGLGGLGRLRSARGRGSEAADAVGRNCFAATQRDWKVCTGTFSALSHALFCCCWAMAAAASAGPVRSGPRADSRRRRPPAAAAARRASSCWPPIPGASVQDQLKVG